MPAKVRILLPAYPELNKKMISKTKIKQRKERKTDSKIVETITEMQKHKEWQKLAQIVAGSKRKYSSLNLRKIDRETKEGDTVVIPGKVLGSGDLTKRIRVCAINFSDSAKEKLKEIKAETIFLIDEVRKNPRAAGVKILR